MTRCAERLVLRIFLAGGVANYIGTYWPVGDAAAKTFAETFYGALLNGSPIGNALLEARRARELDSAPAQRTGQTTYSMATRHLD